jgi:FKBP-type peptidyl-prolyl cis-trans isomerase
MRVLLFVVLAAASCTPQHEGYDHVAQGTYRRMIALGDGDRLARLGDRLGLQLRISVAQGNGDALMMAERSLLCDTSAMGTALVGLGVGDSAALLVPSAAMPWPQLAMADRAVPADTTLMALFLRVVTVRSAEEEAREEEAYATWRKDRELEEQAILSRYCAQHGLDTSQAIWGMYVVEQVPGKGDTLRTGDELALSYIGRTLDGKVFDDNYRSEQTLHFALGDPDQVIRGFDLGLRRLRPGSEALFIIPSYHAFGEKGSAGGLVPPFTPVIYEVRVVEARRPRAYAP